MSIPNINLQKQLFLSLIRRGATVIKPVWFQPDREKAHGRMWRGGAELEYKGHRLIFQIWHHGKDEETLDSISANALSLEFFDGMDVGRKCIVQGESLYVHETGWFGDEALTEEVSKACDTQTLSLVPGMKQIA